MRTVLRAGPCYHGMEDVEIRGFEGGAVKFVRNVATQYHVRLGCESQGPRQGRFEVMRLLQRWDLSFLPSASRILEATLTLCQEDTTASSHHAPLRFPVSFYVHEVKRSWEPGSGGVHRDNLSRPAAGEVWWLEAKAGEAPWRIPGCGHASDTDPETDREAHALAWGRVTSPRDCLRFEGPRLAAAAERAVRNGKPLDLLLKASDDDELRPGSVKCFTSSEFGATQGSTLRPCLELVWQAPALWTASSPFLLEPGARAVLRPDAPRFDGDDLFLYASVSLDETQVDESAGGEVLPAGVHLANPAVTDEETASEIPLLTSPVKGPLSHPLEVTVSTQLSRIPLGEEFVSALTQTWTPSVSRPDDLEVEFVFEAPSGRRRAARAQHTRSHRYEVRFNPDELGVWRYEWSTRPDRNYREQRDHGYFAVIRGRTEHPAALCRVVAALQADVTRARRGLKERRQLHYRLTALQREIHETLLAAIERDEPAEVADGLRRALEDVVGLLRHASV